MSYPTSITSFTTKQDGVDYPQVAHINGLQTEVTAIESGLLSGLQHPLTISIGGITQSASTGGNTLAGPSTLASLHVTGGSTFAGPVTFAAGFADPVTFSSGAVISTGVVRQNSLPSWNVSVSTYVAVGAGSSVGLAFDTQDVVRGNIAHSTGVNSSRIAITSTGLYALQYHGRYQTDGAGSTAVVIHIRQNDATNLLTYLKGAASTGYFTADFGGLVRIADACYLTVVAVSPGAGGSTHGSSATSEAARFTGHFLG